MRNFLRLVQRHGVPQSVISLIFFARFKCYISPQANVQLSRRIRIGARTTVKAFAVIQTSGGAITIGPDCGVNNLVHISTGLADVTIGAKVRVGPGAVLMGSSRNFDDEEVPIMAQGYVDHGLQIGDDVLIGANATVIGCEIGRGAVIGANSVVKHDVAAYAIVAGSPARVIGHRGANRPASYRENQRPAGCES